MKNKRSEIIMLLVLSISTFNLKVMAQMDKNYRKIEMEKISNPINVPADSLWNIVKEFDDVAIWSSAMDRITLHGEPEFEGANCNSRTCESAHGFGTVKEKLILFNNESRELAYESIEGGPGFLLYGQNHWTIVELGPNQSALKIDFEMHIKRFSGFFIRGILKRTISKGLPNFFSDLKTYAETGEISKAKKERNKKYEKKYKVIKRKLKSEIINVSADSLWTICREFDKAAEWTSTLNHSFGTGKPKHEGATCSARICETNFGNENKVEEELIMFSDKNKELSYNLTDGAPGFIVLANNNWKTIEITPHQSRMEMNVTMHMKKIAGFFLGGLITKQMKKQVNIVLGELKIYAETGEVSKTKKKQLRILKKKEEQKKVILN